MDNEKFELGQVKISDDVVIIIAGIAASQVKGVNTARTGVTDGITNLFSKNNYAKGKKVEVTEETVVVDIFINVEYGYRINELAKEVQLAIKKEIETMTDLQVAAVNVHVLNIVDKEKDKDKIKDKEPVDIALE